MLGLPEYPDTDVLAVTIAEAGLAAEGIVMEVATKLPSPLPEWFAKVFTIPGRQVCRRTMWCQVIAQVYGPAAGDVECARRARLLAAVLRAAPESPLGDGVVTEPCECNGPFPSQDPDFPHLSRYQVNLTWTVQSTV